MQSKPRIRPKDIEAALAGLNRMKGLVYPAVGYVYYADVKGDGTNQRRVYRICNENGGVRIAYDLQGSTMRKTLANIESVKAEYK